MILDWVVDASMHFWLASLLGLLAYWLTLTIFFAPCFILEHLTGKPTPRAVIYGMLILSLLLGILLAFMSHAWLDGFVSWWQTPLGPPLEFNFQNS